MASRLPAVHVGLGPGIAAVQVKFMPGPRSNGTWSHEPGDMLIAKVNAESATLVLTSMRAPGIQPLDIAVERLDARHEPKSITSLRASQHRRRFRHQPIAAAVGLHAIAVYARDIPNGSARGRGSGQT